MTTKQEEGKDSMASLDLAYTNTDASNIEADPIQITLSGHTCSGKTEWLSSLLGTEVGETSPMIDTTQKITGQGFCLSGAHTNIERDAGQVENRPYIKIWDVPGQEFSGEILEQAQEELGPRPRPRQMEEFIERHKEAEGDHQSDIRLLDHFRGCDVILYLADCQHTPSVRVEDEFELVRRLGRPVIAVLNFSGSHVQTDRNILDQWREAFELEGARSVVELDAFDRDPTAIRELGAQLVAVFHDQPLKAKFMWKYWQEEIIAREDQRIDEAVSILADFLVNAATYIVKEPLGRGTGQKAAEKRAKAEFQKFTIKELAELPDALLEAYPEFASASTSVGREDRGAADGRSEHHPGPFGDDPGKQVPKSLGRGAIVGGLIGGVLAGVLSDGLGAPAGAAVGASIGAAIDIGFSLKVRKTWLGRLGSCLEIQLAERTVKACCVDGLALIDALRRRGVADNAPLNLKARRKCIPDPVQVMKMLKQKQDKHGWCHWAGDERPSPRRQAFVDELALELRETLDRAGDAPSRGKAAMAKAGSALFECVSGIASRFKK